MKKIVSLAGRWRNVADTLKRFPLTVILLLAVTITNSLIIMDIFDTEECLMLTISLSIGSLLSVVCQLLYEHFFSKKLYRYIFMAAALLLTFLYYLLIRNAVWDAETSVRSIVITFILSVLLIWIPSIKGRINFNQSFLAVFKAFCMALFLNGVLFIGVAFILGAVNLLLFDINSDAFLHAANIIFAFLSPVSFLLYLPVFPADRQRKHATAGDTNKGDGNTEAENISGIKADEEEKLDRLISCGKFLETLISYIIIPVAAVFTLILAIYILINITGSFWTDNLLESMLVAYSITVIFVYLLASTINNAWSRSFRAVFPKLLVIVVLFQTIASLMRISQNGITYGRYYVILFGIFSVIAGFIFSILPKEKNGLIAPVLVILSVISLLPGIGAFPLSKSNQIGRLKEALIRNNMLSDDRIIANGNIPDKDKEIIRSSFSYLNRSNYVKDISWLSEYSEHYNFSKIFGFEMYEDEVKAYKYINIGRQNSDGIDIAGYDYLAVVDIYNDSNGEVASFNKNGKSYSLDWIRNDNQQLLSLREGQTQLAYFEFDKIFARFADEEESTEKSTEDVTFVEENDKISIKLIINYFSFNAYDPTDNYNGQLYVLVKVK
ncbi:MAG: DUF4153 domain-containing protein [Clostridiales bacterium]|nr:DUF4153 domain-containing protein [Clostridiales bacterium]